MGLGAGEAAADFGVDEDVFETGILLVRLDAPDVFVQRGDGG